MVVKTGDLSVLGQKIDEYHQGIAENIIVLSKDKILNDLRQCADTYLDDGRFVTSVAVYLDVDGGASNDTRFDFTSALNGTDGNHRRDFAFNGGFYNDESLGNRFVFSASNTAGRGDAYPKNPGRDPFAISTSGWYYLQHDFYDAGAGVVAVDLSILNATGSTIKTWTLSDLTDIANDTAGGNRYGWFASNEFPFLAIDNSSLTVVPEPATMVLLGLGGLLIRRKRRA